MAKLRIILITTADAQACSYVPLASFPARVNTRVCPYVSPSPIPSFTPPFSPITIPRQSRYTGPPPPIHPSPPHLFTHHLFTSPPPHSKLKTQNFPTTPTLRETTPHLHLISPIHPSTHPPIHPSTHLPISPSPHLPISPISPSPHLPHPPISPSTHPPISPSTP